MVQSDIILYVIDASEVNNEVLEQIMHRDFIPEREKMIIVANKTDLGINNEMHKQLKLFKIPFQMVSAKTGEGLTDLKQMVVDKTSRRQQILSDDVIVTNGRHYDILDRVIQRLDTADNALESGHGFEFAAVDLREALNVLGEITGESATDDILNRIFANFCIGK